MYWSPGTTKVFENFSSHLIRIFPVFFLTANSDLFSTGVKVNLSMDAALATFSVAKKMQNEARKHKFILI